MDVLLFLAYFIEYICTLRSLAGHNGKILNPVRNRTLNIGTATKNNSHRKRLCAYPILPFPLEIYMREAKPIFFVSLPFLFFPQFFFQMLPENLRKSASCTQDSILFLQCYLYCNCSLQKLSLTLKFEL